MVFFHGTTYVFSRNNLSRMKDGAYVINLDDKNTKGTHSGSLYFDKKSSVLLFFWN